MNRITSHYLPRARAILTAFREAHLAPAGAKPLDGKAEQVRQRSPAGWSVSRAQLATELQQRLDGATLPDQRGTSYCGCAAFLYCLLEDRPDWYVAYATALWQGTPFTFASARETLAVTASHGTKESLVTIQQTRTPDPRISSLDWMTMASLSGATRLQRGAAPTASKPTDRARAITWPWMVRRWFASVGATARLDSVGNGLSEASQLDLLELLGMWGSHWLVMQIDASLLNGGSPLITQRHWVVVDPETPPLIQPPGMHGGLSPANFKARQRTELAKENNAYAAQTRLDTHAAALTNLRVVTWGNEHHPLRDGTLANICHRFYGGYAFPRFNR